MRHGTVCWLEDVEAITLENQSLEIKQRMGYLRVF